MALKELFSVTEALEYLSPGDKLISRNSHGSGGCINSTYKLSLKSGKSYFIKENSHGPSDMFLREAQGLFALSEKFSLKVPIPLALGKEGSRNFLIMELIMDSPKDKHFWELFGRAVADLHKSKGADTFGYKSDNYIGSTRQVNDEMDCWTDFFCEKRLIYQMELAASRHLTDSYITEGVEKICEKIGEILPEPEFPSLLHGDLWSGNYMTDKEGRPVLIDPAVYYGHREADLAMSEMFGRFDKRFYSSYGEVFPRDKGYSGRRDLYNLYHMLNHLNLFGSSYVGSVKSIISAYL